MIEEFKHKGLREFFTHGITAGIINEHKRRLKMILEMLHASENIEDINFPGSNLHKLKGDMKEYWSIRLSGNWRIIFKFNRGKAYALDYVDYH